MDASSPHARSLAAALVLALGACTAPEPPPPDLAAIEAEVEATSESVVAAEEAMDIETALTYWAPDAVVHPANRPAIQGIDAIRALYEEFFGEGSPVTEFEGTITAIHPGPSGETAWEHGVNRMVMDTPDGPVTDVGKYLTVWEKRDGSWKIAALAFSSDALPAM